jgi:hypothetical protein
VSDWRQREELRFSSGQYTRLPWDPDEVSPILEHYAHISEDDPSKIAYTPDDRFGREDRQLKTRPGRYLNKYYKDRLSPVDIQRLAGRWASENETHVLKIARTPDEIERVYVEGPGACMSYSLDRYHSTERPVRVYGDADLGVAYVNSRDGTPAARVVCWPDRKVYTAHGSSPYGDRDRLLPALEKAGYEPGSFDGARLRLVEERGTYVCPWIDGPYSVTPEGDYLVINSSGIGYGTQTQTGFVGPPPDPCGNCSDPIDAEESYTVGNYLWCERCYSEDAAHCPECDESYPVCDMTLFDGSYYCEFRCIDRVSVECAKCSARVCTDDASNVSNESWCDTCAGEHAVYCDQCEEMCESEGAEEIGRDRVWCADCIESDAEKCLPIATRIGKTPTVRRSLPYHSARSSGLPFPAPVAGGR